MKINDFLVLTKDSVDYEKIYTLVIKRGVTPEAILTPVEGNCLYLFFTPYLKNRGGREDAIQKHVEEIISGIVAEGTSKNVPPIIVDINTLQIADGNCRVKAYNTIIEEGLLDELVIRVIYEDIPEDKFDERVIQLNMGQKSWTTLDFVYNLMLRGSEAHKRLVNFCMSEDTLNKDGRINPRYAAAALQVPVKKLVERSLVITDDDVKRGREVVREAADIRLKFSTDYKANGGGWYEPYLRAWAEFRQKLQEKKIPFDVYLRAVCKTVDKKRDNPVPYGSNKKADWFNWFSSTLIREVA